jgi:hypothetical protein
MPSSKGLCKVGIEPTPTFGNALIQGALPNVKILSQNLDGLDDPHKKEDPLEKGKTLHQKNKILLR